MCSSAALTNLTNHHPFTLTTHSPFSLFPFFLQVPRDHRQVIQNRELKALLDRVDPGKQGTIPLAAMRKTLTKLLPPPPEKLDRVPAKVCDRESHARTLARTQRGANEHPQPPPRDLPSPPSHPSLSTHKQVTSASLPSLLTLEQKQTLSQYDQYLAAFKAVDTDNSGTISKRELLEVLKKAGLASGKQALEVFSGFDQDGDGKLDFEEFARIAKILC